MLKYLYILIPRRSFIGHCIFFINLMYKLPYCNALGLYFLPDVNATAVILGNVVRDYRANFFLMFKINLIRSMQ